MTWWIWLLIIIGSPILLLFIAIAAIAWLISDDKEEWFRTNHPAYYDDYSNGEQEKMG
jgi:hypothetical protein